MVSIVAVILAAAVIINISDSYRAFTAPAIPVASPASQTTPTTQTTVPTTTVTETTTSTEASTAETTVTTTTSSTQPVVVTTVTMPPEAQKAAYLTFDDGPSDNTPKLLDILDRYNVKATFFVVYRKGQEANYRAIVERGHSIGLHSWSHDYADIYRSEEAYFNDLDRIGNHVQQLVGFRPNIMRFPGGSSNTVSKKYSHGIMTRLVTSVQARGYRYFDWNVGSGDATALVVSKDTIVNNVRNGLGNKPHAIILMHDSPAKTTTVDALPQIIDLLLERGYTILPITDTTEPVHMTVAN